MTKLREIARALGAVNVASGGGTAYLHDPEILETLALTALLAMKNPTEEMIVLGTKIAVRELDPDVMDIEPGIPIVFNAMIDAALSEK